MAKAQTKSQKVREKLLHPVIDSDGHTVECEAAFLEYLKDVGGARMIDRYRATDIFGLFVDTRGGWYRLNPEERRHRRVTRRPWWGLPAKNTLDRATAIEARKL